MSESISLTFTVCRLVAYLVANIVKDEKEYAEWGLPFIALSVEAQFGKEEGQKVLQELDSKFCPLIGHGLSLILEDIDQDDYTLIHSAEHLLGSILNETEQNVADFEPTLKTYLDNFFQYILKNCADDIYDARVRVIARRMCDALNITAAEFGELESLHWQETTGDCTNPELKEGCEGESALQRRFHDIFNHDSKSIPRSSILASFRIWRVAFIATGGGALMALCGRLAAPAIVNTVVPLLCATNTVGQVAMGLSTVLSCFGLTSLELIPGIMSSYAATIAGTKMLNRTAPLQEFALKPLHLDGTERQLLLQRTRSGHGGRLLEDACNTKCTTDASAREHQPQKEQKQHAPVYILVSGHLVRGVDARQLWGADGFMQSVERGADSLLEEVTKMVTVNITAATSVHAFAGDNDTSEARPQGSEAAGVGGVRNTSAENVHSSADTTETTTSSTAAVPAVPSAPSSGDSASTAISEGEPHQQSLSEWEELSGSVPGWWRENIKHGDEYVLHWEPSVLEKLNESLQKIIVNKMLGKLKGMVKGEILKFTPIPALRAAATLPLMLMDKINELDDPWVVAMDRANQAGKLLARVLLAEHHRNKEVRCGQAAGGQQPSTAGRLVGRPITLVGYGMGARLIFHCLETLAAEGGAEARGIVENAVLIGTPVGMERSKWAAARSVVAGRLINCYAWNDWLLALLYRCKSYEIGVAGLYPIVLHNMVTTDMTVRSTKDVAIEGTAAALDDGNVKVETSSERAAALLASDATIEDCDVAAAVAPAAVRKYTVRSYASSLDVENCDVSHLIRSHSDYPNVLPAIMNLLKL